jgi:hypothetical protein
MIKKENINTAYVITISIVAALGFSGMGISLVCFRCLSNRKGNERIEIKNIFIVKEE